MSDKITWIRPSGSEITTNGLPETIKYAASLGWKPKGDESEPVPATTPKAGRPKKGD